MQGRNNSIDVLKGICILLMVYGHVTYVGSMSAMQHGVVVWIYTFHMPIFFLVSGLFYRWADSSERLRERLVSRLMRPYFVFLTLYIVGLYLVEGVFGFSSRNSPPKDFYEFLSRLFLRPIGGYWFLHALIVLQLSFYLSSIGFSSQRRKIFWMAGLISVASVALGLLDVRAFVFFFIGLIFAKLGGNRCFGPAWMGAGVIALFVTLDVDVGPDPDVYSVIWVIGVLSLLKYFSDNVSDSAIGVYLSWIGRNTLLILVLHAAGILLLRPFSHVLVNYESTGLLYSFLATISGVMIPLLVGGGMDRLGISRYVFAMENVRSPIR